MPSIESIVKALKSQNFGNDDSVLVSGLMHPLEAARKAGQALKRNMDIAAGVPDQYDNPTPWLTPSMEQRAEAGLNLAGLLQTGAMPFSPRSAGGVLGTVVKKGLPETPFSKAHETARKNAMLPVEQGGLGLPENNTAMDRARAMGYTAYDDPEYISSALSGKGGGVNNNLGAITKWLADNGIPYKPDYAKTTKSTYINLEGDLYPTRNGGTSPSDLQIRLSDHSKNIKKTFFNTGVSDDYLADIIPHGHTVDDAIDRIKKTPGIRSRLAAFDPMKKNSANILASGLLGSLLLGNDEKAPVMGSIIKKRSD